MVAVTVKTLRVNFVADIAKFQRSLGLASRSIQSTAAAMRRAGRTLSFAVTVPIAAAGATLIKFASDSEERMNKLNLVFGDSAREILMWSRDFDKATRRGREATQDLLADIGDFAFGLGVSGPLLNELSKGVVRLTADLSSFKNIQADRAFNAIRSALAGEREAIKLVSGPINELMVQHELLNLGFEGNVKNATAAQKAIATFNIILRQSEKAIGDAERTAMGFANALRGLKERASDAATSLGKELLPAATVLVNVFVNLVDRFNALDMNTKRWILGLSAAAAVVGPLLVALGIFSASLLAIGTLTLNVGKVLFGVLAGGVLFSIELIGVLAETLVLLGKILLGLAGLITLKVLAVLAALAAAAAVVVVVWKNWSKISDFVKQVFDDVKKWLQDKLRIVFENLANLIDGVVDKFKALLPDFLIEKIQGLTNNVRGLSVNFQSLGDDLSGAAGKAKVWLFENNSLIAGAKNLSTWMVELAMNAKNAIATLGENYVNDFLSGWNNIITQVRAGTITAMDALKQFAALTKDLANLPPIQPLQLPAGRQAETFAQRMKSELEAIPRTADFVADSVDGIGRSLADAIGDGENFGEAMKAVFREVAKEIIVATTKAFIFKSILGIAGQVFTTSPASPAPAKTTESGFTLQGPVFGLKNGGRISAGQFAVVGEAGPELIGGPATVTPMSQGAGISITINNAPGVEVSPQVSSNGRDVRLMVKNVMLEELQIGAGNRALRNTFPNLKNASLIGG